MRRLLLSSLSAIALLAACGPTEDLTTVPAATYDEATTAQLTSNPLLAEWTGEHGGQPAFDKMDLAQLKPAMEAGMAAHLAEQPREGFVREHHRRDGARRRGA